MSMNRIDGDLRHLIRDVPDFPKPGILFRDLTPLMRHGPAFREVIARLADRTLPYRPAALAAVESRGFIFGAALASLLGIGFVPLRKPGKLPWKTRRQGYDLEYGSDGIEIHEDALEPGARVVLIDDLLATGGTAAAAVGLAQGLGAEVAAAVFVVELADLRGRDRLGGVPVEAVVVY